MPNWIASIIGKFIGRKIGLKEGPMDGTKPWYQSKNIWTGVVTVLIAAYSAGAATFKLPAIPEWIFAILGAIGIYTRSVATDKIG